MKKIRLVGVVAPRRRLVAACAALTIVLGITVAGPAVAAPGFDDRAAAALAAAPVKTRVLDDVAAKSSDVADVPTDPEEGIGLESGLGTKLEISLPFGEEASDGVSVEGGGIAYDNRNGSLTVPVTKTDGSVQITTVIEHSNAPIAYSYDLTGASELTLTLFDDGSVVLHDADGGYAGGVAPPWAYDAVGDPVKTWYEVSGLTLTQIVAHDSDSPAYPIVADPWLGINLFGTISVDSVQGQPRVNLTPSPWGYAQWGTVSGLVIMNTAGWDEAWTRSASIQSALNKPSQRQQFECHALGSPFAGTWNLEKFRVNRTTSWTFGVAIHRCNWTTATQY